MKLKMIITLMATIWLSACATAKPRIIDFPNLGVTLIQAPPGNVRKNCVSEKTVSDYGIPLTNMDNPPGCFKPFKNEVWLDWYSNDMELLIHEFCHVDGSRTRKQCADLTQ